MAEFGTSRNWAGACSAAGWWWGERTGVLYRLTASDLLLCQAASAGWIGKQTAAWSFVCEQCQCGTLNAASLQQSCLFSMRLWVCSRKNEALLQTPRASDVPSVDNTPNANPQHKTHKATLRTHSPSRHGSCHAKLPSTHIAVWRCAGVHALFQLLSALVAGMPS